MRALARIELRIPSRLRGVRLVRGARSKLKTNLSLFSEFPEEIPRRVVCRELGGCREVKGGESKLPLIPLREHS